MAVYCVTVRYASVWIFRRTKNLDLCGLRRAETEQGISYPSKAEKCRSIVPRSIEKADKKSLPAFCCKCATIFMFVADTVL